MQSSSLTNMIKNVLTHNQRYVLNGNVELTGFYYSSGWRIIIPDYSNEVIFSTVVSKLDSTKGKKDPDRVVELISNTIVDITDPIFDRVLAYTKELDNRYSLFRYDKDVGEKLKQLVKINEPEVGYTGWRGYLDVENFKGRCYLCLIDLYFSSPIEFMKGIDFLT